MSDRFGSRWHLTARIVFAETLVPVGVAAAAGIAASMIVRPHWRAAGLPYLLGYGKNVESTAIAVALAAGASTQLFAGSRRGLRVCALLAALGFALVVARCPVLPLLSGWPQLAGIAGMVAVLGVAGSERAPGRAPGAGSQVARTSGVRGALAAALVTVPVAALVAALAFAALALTVGPPLLSSGVFHHGEVLSTAVDLLRGGRPFETLIWPHGLHDTGLAALWIGVTGKVGTSPVALAQASCCGLGVVAAYVLARRLLGSRSTALVACLAVALTPLLLDEPPMGSAARALRDLGVMVFVALGLAAVTARRRHDLAAGLCCGLAHLFRIEIGVYAALAALAVIAYRELAGPDRPPSWAAARALGGAVLRFAAGVALVLGGARLTLGWPGAAWFAYTLGDLPRYHRDAVGVPLCWPRRGVELSPVQLACLPLALARLLLPLLLLVQALRAVREHRRRRPHSEPLRAAQVLFVALFTALATKSALDRSDMDHLLQWTALPWFATACLAVGAWSDRRSWSTGRTAAAVFVLFLVLDLECLDFRFPEPRSPTAMALAARERWQGFVEHLSPNPPVGGCADRMFTPGEARLDANRRLIAAECAVEGLLHAHGVGRMVSADAAPWYDVRFRLAPATRYFALARAYTPARQLELIAALRAKPAQALLLPLGHGGLRDFDLPDAVRVPVADAYLRGRREGVAVTPTPVGDLFLWNEPPACPPVAHPGGGRFQVEISAELVTYQPASGVLFAKGWAAETAPRRPLAALAARDLPPGAAASLEYGLGRGVPGAKGASDRTGWELVCRGLRALPAGRALALEAVTAGGGAARVQLDLSAARLLGPLLGAEWDGLGAAIDRAMALGRADRAASLQHRRELARQPVAGAVAKGAAAPGVGCDLGRLGEVVREVALEAGGEGGVEHHQVALGVEEEGAEVEVGRADDGEVAVGDQRFGMEDGGLVLEDADAVPQEVGEVAVAGVADDRHVAALGQQQADVDATAGGIAEDPHGGVAGREVGVGDQEALARRGGDRYQRRGGLAVATHRAGVEHQHAGAVIVGKGHRERRQVERLSAGELPALREDDRQVPGGGTGDAHVAVAPGPAGRARRAVLDADVHAAGEAEAAVHHQELAVIAERLVPEALEQRVEEMGGDAALRHFAPEFGTGRHRAQGVGQHAHHDAAAHRRRQLVEQCAADLVVLEDVGLEQHLVAGGGDRRVHGGESLFAAVVELEAVAGMDRLGLDAAQQRLELGAVHAAGQGAGQAADAAGGELARQAVADAGPQHRPQVAQQPPAPPRRPGAPGRARGAVTCRGPLAPKLQGPAPLAAAAAARREPP
jgi:hypothetical protein